MNHSPCRSAAAPAEGLSISLKNGSGSMLYWGYDGVPCDVHDQDRSAGLPREDRLTPDMKPITAPQNAELQVELAVGIHGPWPCRLNALPVNLIGSNVVRPCAIENTTSAESNAVFPDVRGRSLMVDMFSTAGSTLASRRSGGSSPRLPWVMCASPPP